MNKLAWLEFQYFCIVLFGSVLFTVELIVPFLQYVSGSSIVMYYFLYFIHIIGIGFMFNLHQEWFNKEYKSDNTCF